MWNNCLMFGHKPNPKLIFEYVRKIPIFFDPIIWNNKSWWSDVLSSLSHVIVVIQKHLLSSYLIIGSITWSEFHLSKHFVIVFDNWWNHCSDQQILQRGLGGHKRKVHLFISFDGIKIRDANTSELLYHHSVPQISFISRDESDTRAFGYVFGSSSTGHQFIAFKVCQPSPTQSFPYGT